MILTHVKLLSPGGCMRLAGLLPLLAPVALLREHTRPRLRPPLPAIRSSRSSGLPPATTPTWARPRCTTSRMSTAPLTEQNFAFACRAVPLRASRAGTVERFHGEEAPTRSDLPLRHPHLRRAGELVADVERLRPSRKPERQGLRGRHPDATARLSPRSYPNPARSTTHFSLQLPARDDVLYRRRSTPWDAVFARCSRACSPPDGRSWRGISGTSWGRVSSRGSTWFARGLAPRRGASG